MDLRLPIGLLFALIGVILTATGLMTATPVLGLNVNLIWGLVLVAFGGAALLLSRSSWRR